MSVASHWLRPQSYLVLEGLFCSLNERKARMTTGCLLSSIQQSKPTQQEVHKAGQPPPRGSRRVRGIPGDQTTSACSVAYSEGTKGAETLRSNSHTMHLPLQVVAHIVSSSERARSVYTRLRRVVAEFNLNEPLAASEKRRMQRIYPI